MGNFKQIKASAGAGKTYTLTAEYLEKLKNCVPRMSGGKMACGMPQNTLAYAVGEILAITFTNAAASEMRSRIIAALKASALAEDGALLPPKVAKEWLNHVLRDLNTVNIRTIDSLFHMIVRASALELGINPHFQPSFEEGEVIRPYIRDFLEKAKEDPALSEMVQKACDVLAEKDNAGFGVGDALSKEILDYSMDALENRLDDFSPVDEIENKIAELEAELKNAARALLDVPDIAWHGTSMGSIKKIVDTGREVLAKDPYACIEANDPAKLFKPSQLPGEMPEHITRAYKNLIATYWNCKKDLPLLEAGIRQLPMIRIACHLAREFNSNIRTEELLPNELIPFYAQNVFKEGHGVSDAICRLGTRLLHILIDEFQDTGDKQWNVLHDLVLEAMSRGGTLTYVGDVKQSIYAFNSANPRLFEAILKDRDLMRLMTGDNKPVSLESNWRSGKNIIEFNNKLFSQLANQGIAKDIISALVPNAPAPIKDNGASHLSAAYKDTAQKPSPKCSIDGYVEGIKLSANDGDLAEQVLDNLIAKLHEIHENHPWSDVLVLVRSNNNASLAARKLLESHIPVISENSLLLKENSLINQSLALFSFLVNPFDDLAFWTLLTGSIIQTHPEMPLSLEDIYNWKVSIHPKDLFLRFKNDFPEIWNKFFKPFHSQALLITPYDLLMEWYKYLSVEQRFSKESAFLRRFMEIVYKAEEKGIQSLNKFLDFWAEKGSEEKAPMPVHANAVRIMTIHKAKGLEAPVTIVPWTNFSYKPIMRHGKHEVDGIVVPLREGLKESGDAYYMNCVAQAQEALNLLYVAFTRPRQELYFFVTESKKRSLYDAIEILLEKAEIELPLKIGEPIKSEYAGEEAIEIQEAPQCGTLDENWIPMRWLPELKIFRAHEEGFSAKRRGTFLHFCLENLKFGDDPLTDAQNALNYGLAFCPTTPPDDSSLKKELLESILWFRKLPQARDWLRAGRPEQTLASADGRELRTDLLVPQKDGFLIIDYKTGHENPEHVTQIRDYINTLEGIYPDKKISGLIVYLDLQAFKTITANGESGLLKEPDLARDKK